MRLGNLFTKKNIIIFGASGHAKVIIEAIELGKKYKIVGLIDTKKEIGGRFLGYPVLGREKDIPKLVSKYNLSGGVIGVGDNWLRYKIYKKVKYTYPKFNFITVLHPACQVSKSALIGEGSVVLSGAVVGACSNVGAHCILNTSSSLDHDSNMGKFSTLAPNAVTGGGVTIDKFSSVCIGAVVINGVLIGKHSIVGAGSVVTKNIPEFSVSYGVPAKVIRARKAGDQYL